MDVIITAIFVWRYNLAYEYANGTFDMYPSNNERFDRHTCIILVDYIPTMHTESSFVVVAVVADDVIMVVVVAVAAADASSFQ